MPIRIEHVEGVVDAAVQLRRKIDELRPSRGEELAGVAQLAIGCDLHTDRHRRAPLPKTQLRACFNRHEDERVVLRRRPQKFARKAVDARLFRQDETQSLLVKVLGGFEVFDEEAQRTDLRNAERPPEHDAFDLVYSRQLVPMYRAGLKVDPFCERRPDFVFLRGLWELRLLTETNVRLHRLGLAVAVPTDLFHAVEQFVRMAVGIVKVGMPIRTGPIASDALDLRALLP